MTTITFLIQDPNKGLLPYLESKLGTFDRYNVKPYTFGAMGAQQGILIGGSVGSEELAVRRQEKTCSITIGRILEVSTANVDTFVEAIEFANLLDSLIREWGRCIAPLSKPIGSITGATPLKKNENVATTTTKSKFIVVIREFEISYI